MRYIFMDNFRGFSQTLLPLKRVTFLVGENSTGKSSFLKLLYMLSRPQFWFSPQHAFQDDAELGSFDDIVSAWAKDKSFFRIGVLSSRHDRKKDTFSCEFTLHTFENRDGIPYVSRYIQCTEGHLTRLLFSEKTTCYKTATTPSSFKSAEDVTRFFLEIAQSDLHITDGFKDFPKNIPPNPPLPVAVSILRSIEKGIPIKGNEYEAEIPFSMDLTWIAPIRTKPQRFYDGTKRAFSPEGDHTPFLLKRSLRLRSKSASFAAGLKAFGEASGLFETVSSHSFGSSQQAPFEILVRFAGAALNINNVGYGVSQVLPLIVEFLSREKNRTFAVQQPEVHLHPRAQAALGDLVFQLAEEKGHWFILETHSEYLIDRFRLQMHNSEAPPQAQAIFFQRAACGNHATVIPISAQGTYPHDQPSEFRSFFIKEELKLLEV